MNMLHVLAMARGKLGQRPSSAAEVIGLILVNTRV